MMHLADIISAAVEMSEEIVPDEALTGLFISTVLGTHSRGMLPLFVFTDISGFRWPYHSGCATVSSAGA